MFTSDGGWKEFGIGRNPERFTWFPFWLFTLVWALISFFLVQIEQNGRRLIRWNL